MKNTIYRKMTSIKMDGIKDVYLVMFRSEGGRGENYYLSSQPCGEEADNYNNLIADHILDIMQAIAMSNIGEAQIKLARGDYFLLKTIQW